ncbi:hypothetical protein GCM10009429_33400 [Dyella marensis]
MAGIAVRAVAYHAIRTMPFSATGSSLTDACSTFNRNRVASSRTCGKPATVPTTTRSRPSSSSGSRDSIARAPHHAAQAAPIITKETTRARGEYHASQTIRTSSAAAQPLGGSTGIHCTASTPARNAGASRIAPYSRTAIVHPWEMAQANAMASAISTKTL